MSTASPTRLCLVRHGETDWNIVKRWQGSIDIPLNATGLAQATATAAAVQGMHFDALYSSDLSRASMTAQPIAEVLGLPMALDAGLRERDYGLLQSLTQDEFSAQYPQFFALQKARIINFQPPQGEAVADFATRVEQALARIAQAHPGKSVLAVAHGGVLDICYRIAKQLPLDIPRAWPLLNASLNWLEHDGQRWHLANWGQTAHLSKSEDLSTA